ncbi:hypothetical protein D6833_01590 [Candidatus Parcubacteria bacterium]|nr:MAG: hypothetical protein D6833_01590 [Candidatus Parcubacteria bacterium]
MAADTLLAQNITEFAQGAATALKNKSFNVATTLYFKALAVLADWYLYQKTKHVPKNHAERFRTLQRTMPELYHLLDQAFPLYQDSYTLRIEEERAQTMKRFYDEARRLTGFASDRETRA